MKEEIAAGEVYQIVPSRTFRAPCADPLRAYAALRRFEPNSYRFFVQGADFALLGASPEAAVRVFRSEGWNNVEVRPIAGTRSRGANPDEDDRMESELRLDGKELAEHMMLVDLARNDVARISIPGTRRVAKLMTVERYARVMHLVSSVTGRLAIGFDALDALAACLNVGTLTGAPKIRAMQLLREVERTRRGPYGGAIGWINGAGLMDTAVVIRSALVRDGIAHVRAGAGVVHDSDPQAEADETRRKASALLSVLASVSARPGHDPPRPADRQSGQLQLQSRGVLPAARLHGADGAQRHRRGRGAGHGTRGGGADRALARARWTARCGLLPGTGRAGNRAGAAAGRVPGPSGDRRASRGAGVPRRRARSRQGEPARP
jgi:hypothetical protein